MAQKKRRKTTTNTNKRTTTKRRKRRSYRRLKRMITILCVILLIFGLLFFNRYSISLWKKGYSHDSRKLIINNQKDYIEDYLNLDEVIPVEDYEEYANDHYYYDYYSYMKKHSDASIEQAISYIDSFYELYPSLEELGYPLSYCRKQMSTYSIDDFKTLVDKGIEYSTLKKFMKVNGAQISDIVSYVESGLEPVQAVLNVTYPFINSSVVSDANYLINDPTQLDTLVKSGFMVSSDYVPENLVAVDLPMAADSTNNMMRKDAATALLSMAEDASKEGLSIGIRSAYRSYADQEEVYYYYIDLYGYSYATQLVAVPGYSEHQLGLGVDLTSQSVIDGTYSAFGDTEEYNWVIENGYKYGYILRYPDDKTDITGTMNEPWHFRYVGVEVATEIHENNWTLEEYILNHGFSYSLTRI